MVKEVISASYVATFRIFWCSPIRKQSMDDTVVLWNKLKSSCHAFEMVIDIGGEPKSPAFRNYIYIINILLPSIDNPYYGEAAIHHCHLQISVSRVHKTSPRLSKN